jgi:hypothetical protein
MKKSILAILLITMSCSTTMKITSQPEKARIFINEKYEGETPLQVTKSDSILNHYQIRISKDCHKPINGEIEKELKIGAFIGGLFDFIPWVWGYGPTEDHHFLLEPDKKFCTSN